jgi:hypothetical protein
MYWPRSSRQISPGLMVCGAAAMMAASSNIGAVTSIEFGRIDF